MAPLAPVITPLATAPVTTGTPVATVAQPGGEIDPGPFTYSTTSPEVTVNGSNLTAASDLAAGTYTLTATADSAGGTSPEGSVELTLTDTAGSGSAEWGADDGYADNPTFPPIPADPAAQGYQYFLVQATHTIVPHARDGVDFVVGRTEKYSDIESLYWNDALLGPRPVQEIEDLARALAAESPRLNP